jgi:hypothetical protein
MNIKQRAALKTAGMLGFCLLAAAIFVGLMNVFSTTSIITVAALASMVFLIYQIYQINVTQIEMKEKYDRKDS